MRDVDSHLTQEENSWDRECGKDTDEDVVIQRIQRERHLVFIEPHSSTCPTSLAIVLVVVTSEEPVPIII